MNWRTQFAASASSFLVRADAARSLRIVSSVAPLSFPRIATALAAVIVGVDLAKTAVLWSFPDAWVRAASALALSATTLATAITIAVAIGVLAVTRSITLGDLGFSRRKPAEALAVGLVVWLAYQAAAWLVARLGLARSLSADSTSTLSEAVLVGYSEELVFRVVAFGGILTAAVRRTSPRRAVWIAGAGAVALFLLSHVPHDLVMLETNVLERYGALAVHGALLTAVYVRTSNLALLATLHALLNQPLLLADPGGMRPLIWLINDAACVAVLVWYRPGTGGTSPEHRRL